MFRIVFGLVACLLMIAQFGCVAIQTFPLSARSGDTITIPIGSQDGVTRDNITVLFYPEGVSTPINLTANVRSIVKIYPDKTSRAWVFDTYMKTANSFMGHGQWQNVVVLDLPTLPVGLGYFNITFDSDVLIPNPAAIQSVDGVNIALEILPGTGLSHSFEYLTSAGSAALMGDLQLLEPMSQVVLRYNKSPANHQTGIRISAAKYKIRLPLATDPTLLERRDIHVVLDERATYGNRQIQINWSHINDLVTVNLIAPTQSQIAANAIRFSILIDPSGNNGNRIDRFGTPVLESFSYFNENGNVVLPDADLPEVVMQGN